MNRTALVTGSSQGIGRAIVLRLADEGYNVVINYKKSRQEAVKLARLLDTKQKPYLVVEADITSKKQVKNMISKIIKKFQGLDIVVNNAGINQNTPFEKIKEEEFDNILNTNFKGAFFVTKYALPYLQKSKDARIIFLSSTNSFTGSPSRAIYSASKSSLLGLTKTLALELAPNILVNAIVPGYIETKMLMQYSSKPRREKLKGIPLKRFGKPEDIANAVAFLCSKDSSYITGQCLHVNGGYFLS